MTDSHFYGDGCEPPHEEPLLDKLRRLDEEANDAPWEYDYDGIGSMICDAHNGFIAEVDIAANGDLAVLLRNLVPEIIAAFELLSTLNGDLRGIETKARELLPYSVDEPIAEDAKAARLRVKSLLSKVSGT